MSEMLSCLIGVSVPIIVTLLILGYAAIYRSGTLSQQEREAYHKDRGEWPDW